MYFGIAAITTTPNVTLPQTLHKTQTVLGSSLYHNVTIKCVPVDCVFFLLQAGGFETVVALPKTNEI